MFVSLTLNKLDPRCRAWARPITMSTINRYRTLVRNISRVYAATTDSAAVLEKGLDEIVACAAPADADAWNKVGTDSERLLTVWAAREKDPAARVLADQLIGALYEFAEAEDEVKADAAPVAPPPTPALVITEPDKIAHVPSTVLTLADTASEASEEAEAEAEVDESASEASEEADADEEEEAEVDESASEAEGEGEVADSDDEVGLEVEQVFYRGRPYWLESNTKQLFAVLGEEDVGDEIGTWPDYPAGKPKINV